MASPVTVILCASYKQLYPRLYRLCQALEDLTPAAGFNNPGALKVTGSGLGSEGENSFLEFESYHDGLYAFLHDMEARCRGRTGLQLYPGSTFLEFIGAYVRERPLGTESRKFAIDVLARGEFHDVNLETKLRWFTCQ